jgi:hypothetical protein
MRIAAAVFVAAHGIGFSIWFLSAWIPAALDRGTRHLSLFPDVPATGAVGKALGLVAVAVLAGFLLAAWGIWVQAAWWPAALLGSAIVSVPIALAVWNPVGIVSVPALLASVALIAATLMPWGERFLGPH